MPPRMPDENSGSRQPRRYAASPGRTADAFNRIAEQIQPHRHSLTRRKHIDNPATQRILARLHHRAGAVVAIGIQKRRQSAGGMLSPTLRRIPAPTSAALGVTFCNTAFTVVSANPLFRGFGLAVG